MIADVYDITIILHV